MHAEAWSYVKAVTSELSPAEIVELGSRDVNGSPRCLFRASRYLGIDIVPGEGVDLVCDASQWIPDRAYDLALCLEVMEHTAKWPGIIRTAATALRPGGVFVVTAATDPRAPHSAVDGSALRDGEHYRNVDADELEVVMEVAGFSNVDVTVEPWGDVYATGVK